MPQARSLRRWRNWSGTVDCEPAHVAFPVTVEEVQSELLRCSEEAERLRVVGKGHAVTALCQSDENLMSLDHFTGIESVDAHSRRVWVRAGTRMKRLGEMLAARGLSLPVFSDHTQQTLGGAVATGSHGSGRDVSALACLVTALRVVLPDGSVRVFSREADGERFNALPVSLGLLGVVTQLELQCVDAYRLAVRRRRDTLPRVVNALDDLRRAHAHLTLYWVPFTDRVDVLTFDPTQDPVTPLGRLGGKPELIADHLLGWGFSQAHRVLPALVERSAWLRELGFSDRAWVCEAHRAFGLPRTVRTLSSEFALPVEALPEALEQMDRLIRALGFNIHLPIVIRFSPANPFWLSPAYGRETANLTLQMPAGLPHADFFAAMWEIFDRHEGRPHWGQVHDKTAEDLRRLYPRFDDFLALRAEFDPHGVLLNRYLSQMLGIPES